MRAHASRRRRQEPAERSEPRNVAARWAGPKEKQGSRNLQKVDYLYDASLGSKTSVATDKNMGESIDISTGNAVTPVGVPCFSYTYGGHKFLKTTELAGENPETRLYLGGAEFVDGQPESYYHGEGRVALTGSEPRFQYKLTDHLGNTMVLFEDKDDDKIITTESMSTDPAMVEVLQRNFYYAFGLPMQGPWNHAPADPDMPYLYNGKELEGELGLGWMDYGARRYDAAIGRWGGVDPLAHAPLNVGTSPYTYVWNNPLKFIDPTGMHGESVEDDYVFDEEGKFLRVNRNSKPDRIVIENSQTGNVIGSYAFNDPSNDGSVINEGTTLIHITEGDISDQMISNGSATTNENSWKYIERESRPAGDQSLLSGKSTGMLDHAGNPNSLITKSNAFYVVGDMAFNDKDFGNFLWGQSGKQLGFSLGTLLSAAHLNNMANGRSDNPGVSTGVFDSPADQRAISRGYQFPNSYNCQRCDVARRPWYESGPKW